MTKVKKKTVSFLTNSGRKIEHYAYVRGGHYAYVRGGKKKETETIDATCSLCGRPGKCHHIEYGWVCLESLEKCAEKYADLMAEEDARG